jgi:hypothetical protein
MELTNEIDLVGGGRIFMTSVDNPEKTKSEIFKKIKGCHKIKNKMVECEKENDWNKAYDIILYHQKQYIEKEQKAKYKRKLSAVAM